MAQYSNLPPSEETLSSYPLFRSKTAYSPAEEEYRRSFSTTYTNPKEQFEVQATASNSSNPRKLRYRISHHVQRLWLWETCACVVAIAAHLAMVALLGVYNNARVSSWTNPLTLNSIISLMITIIKGAALIPIAGALGQLKWRRFWDYRGLSDLDFFDDASRGSLGSLRLIWHLKFWHLASFGALLTVSGFTMDFFAQNVVDTYHNLEITSGVASLPRSHVYTTYTDYTTGEEPGDQLPWVTMISSINFGISYTASMFWADSNLLVWCRTGNCTFGSYQSLGLDRQCRDITEFLDTSDEGVIRIPNGPYLRKGDGLLNASTTTEYPSLDIFKDVGPLLVNFQAIANPMLEEPVAIQCVLYWSVSTFSATNMTNFTLYEPVSSTWTNTSDTARTSYNQSSSIYLTPPECWVNGTHITDPSNQHCTNRITSLAQLGLQNFLTHPSIGMQGEMYKTERGWVVSNLFANALSWVTGYSLPNETYTNLERTINNTAIMMSQGVRQLPVRTDHSNDTHFPANGTVWQYEQFFRIQFVYLVPTHFVVGGSLIFFLITIYLTRLDHPWKTSSLPLVFHGLPPEDRDKIGEVPEMVDMQEAAKGMTVKLAMTPVGQRLVTKQTAKEWETMAAG
ncbi:hypothetical protein GQ43DRAFT_113870 [Delitschia confertaspora ATCC 74209]|uniref:Uncharacterized protein n=1 Tax=Delitschia confertaspora ATCC 74209 TaxID=1513339 RepID=A0A9P4JLT9_9PLEO|nr:hypothetical protein GQ43DRAFT_113870 [Delitschia confertaspora ATCC 74209]